ncbi:MAG: VOC family protein [Planctomycetaceae bacterium]|nr:VOC family protein [Planctomycetaceae bacterium]
MSVIQVETIDHVTIVVRDLDASRRFYLDLLGMREVPRPNFSFAGAWFQAGQTLIHLILEHDLSGPAGNRASQKSTRMQHLAFRVPDANQAWQQMQASGVELEVVSPPKFRPDGAVQIFLADPDGHIIELASEPKQESHS